MNSKIFFQNHLYTDNKDILLSCIAFFKNHQNFQRNLGKFWRLHQKDYDGRISASSLKEHFVLIYKYLFPYFSSSDIDILVTEDIQLASGQNAVIIDQFYELFAKICVLWIETPSISAIESFLDIIYERTTKLVYRTMRNKEMKFREVDFHMELSFRRKNDCERLIPADKKHIRDNVIYYEEKVILNEYLRQQVEMDYEIVAERILMRPDEVIPMGFSLESVLIQLMNQNYTVDLVKKEGKSLLISEHFTTKACLSHGNVKLYAYMDESTIEYLKTFLEHHIYYSCHVLSGSFMPISEETVYHRLNEVLDRKYVFKKLKNKHSPSPQYYNIVSAFHQFEDYEIDLIHRLHQHWQDKSDSHEDTSPYPVFDSLDPSESRLSATNLHFLSIHRKMHNFNPDIQTQFMSLAHIGTSENKVASMENEQPSKDINIPKYEFDLHDDLQQIPKLNFHHYMSKSDTLPYDNLDPYIEDLPYFAQEAPMQLLVVAKPLVGKTAFCAELAKKLDLVHVEPQLCIDRIFKKIKDFEEAPELDEENNPKEFLSQLEREVVNELKSGLQISDLSLLELMNLALEDPNVSLKGFILDVPLVESKDFSWISQILNGSLRIPQINCRYFTHVVNLSVSDEEVLNFAANLKENLDDFKLYSEYDRYQLAHPKPKTEEEAEAEEAEEKKPLLAENLLTRANEDPVFLQPFLDRFASKTLKKLQTITSHLTSSQLIEIEAAGVPSVSLTDVAVAKLNPYRNPLRPLPTRLDPGSDGNLKELLSQGLDEGKPWRKWSGFYQIDPVELSNGKVVLGKAEFPVAFAGRVFLFEKEENLLEFMRNPRGYLENPAKMPKKYNVSLCGPHLSGKKTYAQMLNKLYGWKIVDVQQIVAECILAQKNSTQPSPCNPLTSIHCSETEWKEIFKGGILSTKATLPLVLSHLGFKLMKRPPKPPPKEGDEGYEEYKAAEEAALKEKEELKEKPGSKKGPRPGEIKKGAKKEEKPSEEKEEENPPEQIVEDIPLKDLVPLRDEYGQSEVIKGLLFINFPIHEEHIQALKECGIIIDRVICLVDTNEEETEAGKVLSTRGDFEALYSLENEVATSEATLKMLQEQMGEDIVRTVSIIGPIEEVFNRIRTTIDPFYLRVDEESNVRAVGDVGENDEQIPFGDYGPFCPVTLKDENWLVRQKGETTEGLELQVKGKRYIFYTEKELKMFKTYVEKYVGAIGKIVVPPPRILFMGVRGSGLRTQLKLLNEKFKIMVFDLKEELLAQLNENKRQRKHQRHITRSFKPKEVNEEGQEVEDQELNEEAVDFDRKLHEISVMNDLLSQLNEVFISGNWYDVEEEQVSTEIFELWQESKRMPEAVFTLKAKDKSILNRLFDAAKIKQDYSRQIEELKKKREQERKAEREKLIQENEGNEEFVLPEEEPDQTPIEEDPEAPKLEEMLGEQKDKFLKRREDDTAKIEELSEKFKTANIPVYTIEADGPIQQVFNAIVWELRPILSERTDLIDRYLTQPIPEEKVPLYKLSYHTKLSRFGLFNAVEASHLPIAEENALIYRDRIYFASNAEQLQTMTTHPKSLLGTHTQNNPSIPLDINYSPGVFIVGKPKSGVSSLAKLMENNLGLVRIKISKILENLETNMSKLGFEALTLLKLGNYPNEAMCVELISQRIQQKDCIERGWVLDSFPNTLSQAKLLALKGILPNCVFSVQLNDIDIKMRTEESLKQLKNALETQKMEFLKKKQEENEESEEKKPKSSLLDYEFDYQHQKLGYDSFLLHQKLKKSNKDLSDLENFYLVHYNNVKFLNATLSKWGLFERARNYLQKTIKQRQLLSRGLVLREPSIVGDIGLTKPQILEFYSEFKNYCPVSFKTKHEFIPLSFRSKELAFYNFKLYNLASSSHFKDFKLRPFDYLSKELIQQHRSMPLTVLFASWPLKALTITQEGHDMVELSSKRLAKGKKSLLVEYNGRIFAFKDVQTMENFCRNPNIFANLKLPVKFVEEKVTNEEKTKHRSDSSSSYLENNLSNIAMKVLAQLGYNKLKYPTISPQETALKFIALSLKANNPNKEQYYRDKYSKKLKEFLSACQMSERFYNEHQKREKMKGVDWNDWEEESYLKSAEELEVYLRNISSKDKTSYFYDYIR